MLLSLLGVVAGLSLLTWAAEQFVAGAARLAVALNVSTVVVGAVVIGFGTSAPEIVVSGLAAAQGKLDIAVGNVIGSNVANLSLVLGSAALVVTVRVTGSTLRREAPISVASMLLFALLVQDGLTRAEGVVLLVALGLGLAAIIGSSMSGSDAELAADVDEFVGDEATHPLPREVVRTVVGLVATTAAAQLLVLSASRIATEVGLAEGFVGLTIVAIGTSLPELATSLQAARRDDTDLIVGNLLGSNLFNSAAVGGIAALLGPGRLADPGLAGPAVWLMVVVALLGGVFILNGRQVVRWEGGLLLIVYVATLPLLA